MKSPSCREMRNEIAMETLCNGDITKEPFLKIDTVWSEADENIENFSVKEEIVSDLEVEASDDVHIAENAYGENHLEVNKINNYEAPSTLLSSPVHIFKRGFKNKRHKLENEVVDLGSYSIKSSCPHDTKNFQIINRRLRCGDCRSLVCPECFKIMFSTIHNHFLGFDTSNSSIYLCKFCSFPFQSVCALQAHVRIHTMETPYVCPDCGLIYSNAYFLILHLLNKCFHVYKIVSYKCSRCPNIYFTSGTISKHIQDVHLSCVFRCSCCSLLFDNSVEFKSHVDSTHQKQKVQHLSYFRCNLCSDLVIPSFMYEKHISRHRENSESYEVEYQCLCGDVFSLIGAFRAHIQHCGKKGILPSHWGFLRKNLKSQDAIAGENNCRKMEHDDSNGRGSVSENANENIAISRKNVFTEIGGSVETFKAIHPNDAMTEKTIFRSRSEPKESVPNAVQSGESTRLEISKQIYGDVNEEIDGSKNSGETEGDSCKIFYDYIPCDHLGYVKAQGPEHGARETDVDKVEKKEEKSPTGANYHVVMELDERTGILISKKVSSEMAETEIEEEISQNDSLHENEMEISNLEEAAISRFSKIKSTTSFFACPFCSVLFPKNHSTFQQFKLHLEYYHSDAALNITVNGENGVQNEIALNQNTLFKKSGSLSKCSEKNKMLLEKNHQSQEKGETLEKKEPNAEVEQRGRNEEEEVKVCDCTAVHSENAEKCSTKTDFYWTVNLSVESKKDPGRTDSGEAARKKMVSTGCIKKMNEDSETNETEPYSEFLDERINDKMVVLKESSLIGGGKKRRQKTLDEATIADSIWEKVKNRKKDGDLQTRPIVSDCDDDWENSKDSSWSNGGSDVEYAPSRHSHSLEDYLHRPKVMGKIKRESEVWSEFYESLQLAEKLKKNKKKRSESQLEETKQHSTLAEYSTKRVVKKPKRYRESSESECSYDNGENSENEMETTGPAHRQSERRLTIDEESILDREKRQKLMNKLKNIDQRMVEYLLELATQKGKNLELYKKHFGLGGSRHNHTLRSYRKKVLNGIKLRGRPLKLMRRDQVSKKNDKSIDENAGRDAGWQKTPKKQGEDQERRSKRGRPRKILETAKLKERRRSDKEVDFIEKNFEREETGSSPTKRKRKLSSKLQYYKKINSPEEKDDFSSGQVITGKTGESGKRFSCAVCREIFQDSNGFREHIVSHRQEDNTYQCMECGECFVVRPSLEKHLHAFHKIRNTDEYIVENECGNPRKECPEEPEKETLKENQCKVCRDQFERAIDLTKHFRIHGMAFLKEFKKDGKTRP